MDCSDLLPLVEDWASVEHAAAVDTEESVLVAAGQMDFWEWTWEVGNSANCYCHCYFQA